MEPTKVLMDEIERERVERARRMHPIEKMLAGAALFDTARLLTSLGIRTKHPDADDQTIDRLVHERIDQQRRREAAA